MGFRTHDALGTVIVTGGCGFVGFHIVDALLQEPSCGPIYVLSRAPSTNLHPGVHYLSCDISSAEQVDALFERIKPNVVFHAASPRDTNHLLQAEEFAATNIIGTRNLINSASRVSAKAFVLTSSIAVLAGRSQVNADEESPVWSPKDRDATPYERSKAHAEQIVLAANSTNLPTVALRLGPAYGERDSQMVPNILPALYNKQTHIQLGDNTSLFDLVSVGNAAKAHILAANALLDPERASGKVDGEAFHITDGKPVRFWDNSRLVWRAAGDTTREEDIIVIPAWLAMAVAIVVERAMWILTLGRQRPLVFRKQVISYAVRPWTFNIDKARARLGYHPVPEWEEGIKRSVDWEIAKSGEGKKVA